MRALFGKFNSQDVYCYTLRQGNLEVSILTYGGIVQSIRYPDKQGNPLSIALTRESVEAYQNGDGYYGAIIGRLGNRIENGQFTLNGKTYHLTQNEGNNTLHGGKSGFHDKLWEVLSESETQLRLRYISPDGEEGFPGTLQAIVTYTLENEGLRIDYEAQCDQDTIVNLTNHTYFNLHGIDKTTEGLLLSIDADQITPVDEKLIPHNTFLAVENTLYDFRTPRPFRTDLSQDPVLNKRGCYDENFVLNGEGLRKIATLSSSESGISMDVWTDQPGMQIYTGNPNGIALETQNFPNAIHCDRYPSPILKKGELYKTTTIYQLKKI